MIFDLFKPRKSVEPDEPYYWNGKPANTPPPPLTDEEAELVQELVEEEADTEEGADEVEKDTEGENMAHHSCDASLFNKLELEDHGKYLFTAAIPNVVNYNVEEAGQTSRFLDLPLTDVVILDVSAECNDIHNRSVFIIDVGNRATYEAYSTLLKGLGWHTTGTSVLDEWSPDDISEIQRLRRDLQVLLNCDAVAYVGHTADGGIRKYVAGLAGLSVIRLNPRSADSGVDADVEMFAKLA